MSGRGRRENKREKQDVRCECVYMCMEKSVHVAEAQEAEKLENGKDCLGTLAQCQDISFHREPYGLQKPSIKHHSSSSTLSLNSSYRYHL